MPGPRSGAPKRAWPSALNLGRTKSIWARDRPAPLLGTRSPARARRAGAAGAPAKTAVLLSALAAGPASVAPNAIWPTGLIAGTVKVLYEVAGAPGAGW